MKQAYIATKDKAEHSVNAKENTAEEYAADKTEAEIDEIAHKGAYAFNKAGRKGVQETKKNIQSAKDGIQRFKQQRAEKSINVQRAQGRTTTVGSSSAQTQTSSAINSRLLPQERRTSNLLVRKRRKQRRGQLRLPSIPQRQALRPVSRQQKPHRKQHKPPLRLHRKRHRQQRRYPRPQISAGAQRAEHFSLSSGAGLQAKGHDWDSVDAGLCAPRRRLVSAQ